MAAVNKPLSEKLTKFAEAYAGPAEGNGAKAAESVGCSKASAKVMAARWLKRADVKAAIVHLRELIDNQRQQAETKKERALVADLIERRERMTSILRRSGKNPIAAIKAAEVLNKMDGIYITKLAGPTGGPVVTRVIHEDHDGGY